VLEGTREWLSASLPDVHRRPPRIDLTGIRVGDRCLWSYYRNVHRPHDFSCGDFQLCGDGDFFGPFYTWRTSSDELSGPQAGQNGELECVEIRGTLHHMRLPFSESGWTRPIRIHRANNK
jgi:hypothetical protein